MLTLVLHKTTMGVNFNKYIFVIVSEFKTNNQFLGIRGATRTSFSRKHFNPAGLSHRSLACPVPITLTDSPLPTEIEDIPDLGAEVTSGPTCSKVLVMW